MTRIMDTLSLHAALLLLFIGVCHGAIDVAVAPQSAAGLMGSAITLNCTVTGDLASDTVDWWEYVSDGDGVRLFRSLNNPNKEIDQNHPRRDNYRIEGNYNLVVKSVSGNDAGKYTCQVGSKSLPVQLIALDHFTCRGEETVMEGDDIHIKCKTEFSGNKMPTAEFLLPDGFNATPINLDMPGLIDRNITLKAVPGLDKTTVTCRRFFPNPPPNFSDTCSVDLTVLYSVRDVTIQPSEASKFTVGDTLKCMAKGNPMPEIRWEKVQGNGPDPKPGNQGVLSVDKSMLGKNTYRCLAKNSPKGKEIIKTAEITFEIVEEKSAAVGGPGSGATVISLSWIVMASLLALHRALKY